MPKSELRRVKRACEQFGHDCPTLFFIGRLILYREITIAVPYFDILAGDLYVQVVKLTVKAVLGRIEPQRVTHFRVGYRGAYRASRSLLK